MAILFMSSITLAAGFLVSAVGIEDIIQVQKQLQADDRVFTTEIRKNTFRNFGNVNDQNFHRTSQSLTINIWYNGVPSEAERELIMNDTAKALLQCIDANEYASIKIAVKSGYDIGIASRWRTYYETHSIHDWANIAQ
jgi:hypothetical protein